MRPYLTFKCFETKNSEIHGTNVMKEITIICKQQAEIKNSGRRKRCDVGKNREANNLEAKSEREREILNKVCQCQRY